LSTTSPWFLDAQNSWLWNRRGWTFQEKMLSKRLLIFSMDQCFFHCECGLQLYEDSYSEHDSTITLSRSELSNSQNSGVKGVQTPRYGEPEAFVKYEQAVSLFVGRQLTYRNDSLNAFRGLLNSLESDSQCIIWGIPEVHFQKCLGWLWGQKDVRHGSIISKDADSNVTFPTWSWLSQMAYPPFKTCEFLLKGITGSHLPYKFYRFDDTGTPIQIKTDNSFETPPRRPTMTGSVSYQRVPFPNFPAPPPLKIEQAEPDNPYKFPGVCISEKDKTGETKLLTLIQKHPAPLDHVIGFWGLSMRFEVDRDGCPHPDRLEDVDLTEFALRLPNEMYPPWVFLSDSWRALQGKTLEFIAMPDAWGRDQDAWDGMVVSWEDGMYKRMGISGVIRKVYWENGVWKFFLLR
jgi:hypothetical protein